MDDRPNSVRLPSLKSKNQRNDNPLTGRVETLPNLGAYSQVALRCGSELRTDKVVDRTALPGADGNHGLLIEPKLRLAFIACEDNHRLLVLNLKTKQLVANFEVGQTPDVLGYDADLGRLYVASESGVLSVFKVSATGVEKIGEGSVGPNAHSLAVDPATHEIYFPLKAVDHRPVMRVMKPVA